VVAFDNLTDEIIYNDPWPGTYWPAELKGKSGFNRRLHYKEFLANTKSFRVEIGD
jgi:hypothetical protein